MSTERDDFNPDDNELEPSQTPHANASRILRDTYKDHDNALNAVQWEFGQNGIDALLWSIATQDRGTHPCVIHIRVNTDDNTVEMWDNAIGMRAHKLEYNYLSIGEPGEEKQNTDTGGNQGHGFWAIAGWGDEAYIETHDKEGNRWCARAWPNRLDDNISDIKHPREIGQAPRPELETPGTYVRVEAINDDDMQDLTDPEHAIQNLEEKFAFAISNPDVDLQFKYEIDGDIYEPTEYDFAEIIDEAAVVSDEDLGQFKLKGKTRKLKNLTLIRTSELPDDFEPPWQGVAMLKGGEYTTDVPYMNVWSYTPQHADHVHDQELWGWVDASTLCPDREEHGHTGFLDGSRIYDASGLKSRILEVCNEEFDKDDIEDNTEAAENTRENLIEYLKEYDSTNTTSGSGSPAPDSAKIHASTKGHYFDEGEGVPLYILVTNPDQSDITDFHIKGELQRVIDENGDEIPEDERDDPIRFEDDGPIPLGVKRHMISEDPATYKPPRAGGYEIRLKMREEPDVESDENDVAYQIAVERKPVHDTTTHTFYVGDVEPKTGGGGGDDDDDDGSDDYIINSFGFVTKPDKTYRVNLHQNSEGAWDVRLNESHPEYEQLEQVFEEFSESTVKTELGTKWAFLRIFFEGTSEQINEMLDEKGAANSEIRVNIQNIIQERIEKYDEFCHEFSQQSPLNFE